MNVAEIIVGHDGSRSALIAASGPVTYAELRSRVASTAAGLTNAGVQPGDRVALVAGTEPNFVVGLLGALAAGAIVVPLNPGSPAPEAIRQLNAVGPVALLAGAGYGDHAIAIASGVETITTVGTPAGLVIDGLAELAVAGAPFAPVERADSVEAGLLFTSGTSGDARAASLSHGNLIASQRHVRNAPGSIVTPDSVALLALPLFHIYGLNLVLNSLLAVGASIVLLEEFHPAEFIEATERYRPTIVPGVPPLWAAVAKHPTATVDSFSSVLSATTGAAALPMSVFHTVKERLGIELNEGYGLTETGGIVSSSTGLPVRPGSVGKPLPGVQMRLVDDNVDVPVGDRGEIWVRGENVTGGYWEDLEATGRSITDDGWFRTGDIGVVDDDGYLYLVDRSKDMIIVSGFNVFPAEVEEVLMHHPDVTGVVVIGAPDQRTGEKVVAHVKLIDGSTTTVDDLSEYCLDNLARYKAPSVIEINDDLPISLTGKRMRRLLK